MTSNDTGRSLAPQEHLRQLHHVYGPLSPAFVAAELGCSLKEAGHLLYGPHADRFCWVSLTALAQLSGVGQTGLRRWVRRHHLQSAPQRGRGRGASPHIHVEDARHFLNSRPGTPDATADALPRVSAEDLAAAVTVGAAVVDVDWQLARQAAWPMTVDRLAEAVYGSRAAHARHQTRKALRRWEAQGRVVCFARGLYDVVRPTLVLNPGRWGGSTLPGRDLQHLRAHHPELAHWSDGALAAAWRAYSHCYARTLLPVMDRGEPTLLEYLLVRQLNPAEVPGEVDAWYEELCREAAFYRVVAAPPHSAQETGGPAPTGDNLEAGRWRAQRHPGRSQAPDTGRTAASRGVQEGR